MATGGNVSDRGISYGWLRRLRTSVIELGQTVSSDGGQPDSEFGGATVRDQIGDSLSGVGDWQLRRSGPRRRAGPSGRDWYACSPDLNDSCNGRRIGTGIAVDGDHVSVGTGGETALARESERIGSTRCHRRERLDRCHAN